MNNHDGDDATAVDDRFPRKPIQTSSLTHVRGILTMASEWKQKTGYSAIVVIYGPAGTGKSWSVEDFAERKGFRSDTGCPKVPLISVEPGSTRRAVAMAISECFGEKLRGGSRFLLVREVMEVFKLNTPLMLILDEADRLTEETFDFVRDIHDRTECPPVLVGLKSILDVIHGHEKFESRVAIRAPFRPVKLKEVLEVILPGLVIPHWHFDPKSADDVAMGRNLWNNVKPSLRRLRIALQLASGIAEVRNSPKINASMITEALQMMQAGASARSRGINGKDAGANQEDDLGPYERASQDRQDGKRNRKPHR